LIHEGLKTAGWQTDWLGRPLLRLLRLLRWLYRSGLLLWRSGCRRSPERFGHPVSAKDLVGNRELARLWCVPIPHRLDHPVNPHRPVDGTVANRVLYLSVPDPRRDRIGDAHSGSLLGSGLLGWSRLRLHLRSLHRRLLMFELVAISHFLRVVWVDQLTVVDVVI
jgi:hypothetical protein